MKTIKNGRLVEEPVDDLTITTRPADGPRPADRWAGRAFWAAGALASVFYLVIGSRLWFVNDEWDFLAKRTSLSAHDLFGSHNGHWVTLPVVVYRALWWAVGLHTYVPYQVLIVGLHLVVAALLRRVMLRAGVHPWTATVTALVLVLFGRGEQDILWGFQITYVGALVFGLTHLLLADHDGPLDRRDWLGLTAGTAGMLCSGIAVSMTIVVGIAVLIRRGQRAAAVHTLPLAALYLVWWASMARDAFSASGTTLTQKAKFVATTPLNAFRAMSSFRGGQWLLTALLVVGLVIAWRKCSWMQWRTRYAAPFALLVGAGVFLTITALGRAGPPGASFRSRYIDLALALMLPALAIAADAIARRSRVLAVPVFALLLVGVPSNVHAIDTFTAAERRPTAQYRHSVLAVARNALSREVPRALEPLSGITIGWLVDGVDSGRIPGPGAVSPVENATDTLRLSLRQTRAHGPTAPCRTITIPEIVELRPGRSARAERGTIRVAPPTGPIDGTFPATYESGVVLTPVRATVRFRVLPAGTKVAPRLCGPGPVAPRG